MLWKQDGAFYYCEPSDLIKAQEAAGVDEPHLKRRMGYGFDIWAKALSGVRLTLYEKNHVDWALTPEGVRYKTYDSNLAGGFPNESAKKP
jgi:hypothetical protein